MNFQKDNNNAEAEFKRMRQTDIDIENSKLMLP
jgi:hypothetical protein